MAGIERINRSLATMADMMAGRAAIWCDDRDEICFQHDEAESDRERGLGSDDGLGGTGEGERRVVPVSMGHDRSAFREGEEVATGADDSILCI